jgi:hypothetical protein
LSLGSGETKRECNQERIWVTPSLSRHRSTSPTSLDFVPGTAERTGPDKKLVLLESALVFSQRKLESTSSVEGQCIDASIIYAPHVTFHRSLVHVVKHHTAQCLSGKENVFGFWQMRIPVPGIMTTRYSTTLCQRALQLRNIALSPPLRILTRPEEVDVSVPYLHVTCVFRGTTSTSPTILANLWMDDLSSALEVVLCISSSMRTSQSKIEPRRVYCMAVTLPR